MSGDVRAEALVGDLLACLCNTLAEAGRAACCCQWRTADRLLMPEACSCTCGAGEGVAWVRIDERRFDQTTARRAPSFDGGTCGPAQAREQWLMEMGVARCWPEGEEGLECDAHTAASMDVAWDQHLLHLSLCCEPLSRYGIILDKITTLGPQGGCVAAVATFTVTPSCPPKEPTR